MSNLTQRILTAVVAIPLVLVAVWMGGWIFVGLLLLVALLAQWEVYGLLQASGIQPYSMLGLVLGALVVVQYTVPALWPLVLAVGLIIVASCVVIARKKPLEAVSGTLFGAFYPSALLGSALLLRGAVSPSYGDHVGFWLVLAVLVGVWGADTAAYFAGRAFGKHPLAPSISPKKTWEGAVGGLIGAAVVIVSAKLTVLPLLSWLDLIVLVGCCGIAGPVGDLAESRFKRAAGVKDSANWLPGHGGMLDRLDAAIIAIPVAVLYLRFVAGIV